MGINVAMVRESFEVAKPIANQVVDRFYENLFADFPESKALFTTVDMPKQKAALLHSLVTAVDNLDKPEPLTKFLLGLGERHVKYGVEDLHYGWVGQSLLKTFGQFLGSTWTDELKGQWTEVYGVVADAMKTGARNAKNNIRPIQKERPAQQSASVTVDAYVPTLPTEMKQSIRSSVHTIVLGLIKTEVRRCFEEEMREIARMTPEELVRKAG